MHTVRLDFETDDATDDVVAKRLDSQVMSRRTATRVPSAAKTSAHVRSTSPPAAWPSIAASAEDVSRPSALPAWYGRYCANSEVAGTPVRIGPTTKM